MKIAFTICSNNYLAQAKVLGDSLLEHNPEYAFFICLCDARHPDAAYELLLPHTIVDAGSLGIEKFDEMNEKYTIIELNTSLKPFAFSYLYTLYPEADTVIFLDPDTRLYAPLNAVERELEGNAFLLTPHILTPVELDGQTPTENTFTQFGTFNLGFLATRRNQTTDAMLDWWKRHLEANCYIRPGKGVFVDQLPMNLAPVLFEHVAVSRNPGCNMAPWNHHERRLTLRDGRYFVNDANRLVFYHFSKFKPGAWNSAEGFKGGFSRAYKGDPEIFHAFCRDYEALLLLNGYERLANIPCAFSRKDSPRKKPAPRVVRMIAKWLQ